VRLLVVSKVANFSNDLPEANVAFQISGTFGSCQEEAQRLGRILRPKASGGQASLYTLVSRETQDQEFALHRQLFLAEQGYRYAIDDAAEVGAGEPQAQPAEGGDDSGDSGSRALPDNVIPSRSARAGR
jgi:DNA excision repair protein ERCC-3